MLNHLDNLLRELFLTQISDLTIREQVSFQPPDEHWRNSVANQQRLALNVYLVDLRENRKLRSNERVRHVDVDTGIATEEQASARLDCHYLVTAWSPAQPSPAIEPTLDEHALLYQTTAVLMHNNPLTPSLIYPSGSPELNNWGDFQKVDLPVMVLPVEGFNKLSEFWQNMGQGSRWKPALYLIVTLPVELMPSEAGAIVTSRAMEVRPFGLAESADVLPLQIGGYVIDVTHPLPDGSPAPVPQAWVRLEEPGGAPLRTILTDALGRFTFDHLSPGNYQLRWLAAGHSEPAPRPITIPSPSGEYDLRFE